LPSAGVGALLILMIVHYDLSVIALIGIILLIGIVKKNGIMMVDFAVAAERRDGETPFNAIRQACLLRFRPIMMTTMAALFTGLPLMLGHGAGSELRRPLGYAMVGGLLLSQVLSAASHRAGKSGYRRWLTRWAHPPTDFSPRLAANQRVGEIPAPRKSDFVLATALHTQGRGCFTTEAHRRRRAADSQHRTCRSGRLRRGEGELEPDWCYSHRRNQSLDIQLVDQRCPQHHVSGEDNHRLREAGFRVHAAGNREKPPGPDTKQPCVRRLRRFG
jgi:hypothetical protein